DELRKQNYIVVGAIAPDAAVASAAELPAVDVIIVSEEIGQPAVDQLFSLAGQDLRLSGAAKLVITRTGASPYAVRAANEPGLSVTQATDAAGIKAAADAARAKTTAVIDPQAATNYALRAATLLHELAISRSVLDLTAAHGAILNALRDPRPDVVKAAGAVLGFVPAREAQTAMLQTAAGEKTGDDVKISLYKSMA